MFCSTLSPPRPFKLLSGASAYSFICILRSKSCGHPSGLAGYESPEVVTHGLGLGTAPHSVLDGDSGILPQYRFKVCCVVGFDPANPPHQGER